MEQKRCRMYVCKGLGLEKGIFFMKSNIQMRRMEYEKRSPVEMLFGGVFKAYFNGDCTLRGLMSNHF